MFFSKKRDLDEDTIVLIAIRTAVLVRAREKDSGPLAAHAAFDSSLKFALKELNLNPSEESARALRISASGLAFDSSGFTERMLLRSLQKDVTVTRADIQEALDVVMKGVQGFVAATKR